jgi:RHS repeat-associated protein
VALVAGLVAGVAAQGYLKLGEAIGSAIANPSGAISTGSGNVFTNSLQAAIASVSAAVCSKHPPLPLVAEGSATVYINGQAAARKGDHITCGATIGSGSGNVFIGGGTQPVLAFDSEIPAWVREYTDWAFTIAGLVGGLAGLIKKAGEKSIKALAPCATKFIAGYVAGEAAGRYVVAPAISGLIGNPVDMRSGRKILPADDETDFVLPGRLPLSCSRFYASNLQFSGMLGPGWLHEWDIHLRQQGEDIIHVDFQGRETTFPQLAPGQKIYSVAEQRYLARAEDGRYLVYGLDQSYYEFSGFDATGVARLSAEEDQVGQRIRFQRDESGRLAHIRTGGGQVLAMHYQDIGGAARLSTVELREGGTPGMLVRYEYDEGGQLSGVFNRLNQAQRRFRYQNGLMVEHINALGLVCAYRWAEIDGAMRVVEHHSSEGEHYQFGYDPAARSSWAIDTFGRKACWQFDADAQVIACQYFDGGQNHFAYDANGNLTSITLPGQHQASFAYDELGRMVKETDPLGRITQTQYHETSLHPLCATLADGSQWFAAYDPRGLLLSTQDPLGRRTRYQYDRAGLLEKVVDARGGEKTMQWNAYGQITRYTDCSGKTSQYAYDDDGNLISAIDAMGQSTRFIYTETGEQSAIIHADGEQEQFEYDALGLLQRHTNARGQHRSWQRNARGQVTREISFAQRSQQIRYDAHGRLLELINGNGASYRFDYDAADRVMRQTNPDGICTEYAYDQQGALAQICVTGETESGQPQQRITRLAHDAMGRLLARHTQDASTHYRYDALDRLLCASRQPTAGGQAQGILPDTINFSYDQAGQLIKEEGSQGAIEYELDQLGNLAQMTLPQGQSMGFLRYGSGHTHQIRLGEKVICDIERDDLHREILRTQGRLTSHFGFDARGRRAWQTASLVPAAPSAPQPATLVPDPAQPPGQQRAKDLISRQYRYGLQNELHHKTDQLRGHTRYQYDAQGRLLAGGTDGHALEQFGWDEADNLQTPHQTTPGRTSNGAIKNNRLLVWQDIRYHYDAFGNVASKAKGAWQHQQFRYDAENRLLEVRGHTSDGQSTTRFHYDALGRRITRQVQRPEQQYTGASETSRFIWQGMRMLQEVQDEHISTYVYDPDFDYAPLARMDQHLTADGGIDSDKGSKLYYFHNDQIGTPLEVTREDGALVWAGDYSTWGKVSWQLPQAMPQMEQRIQQNLRFAGQYADESTGLHYNTFRFYDPDIGRFISQDPIGLAGGMNLYQYAPNPVSWIDPLGWSGFDPFAVGEITHFPEDLHFGQNRIGPNFSEIGSQAPPSIRGRPVLVVAQEIKANVISPNELLISYTIDPKTGKAVTLNNRGLAAIIESGKRPTHAIFVPYEHVPPHLVKDIRNRPPSKSISMTHEKSGKGFIKKIGSGC